MRQVPASTYLIIGGGRLSRHLQAYFSLESLSFISWSRQNSVTQLQEASERVSHVLLAISDSAIEPFLKDHPFLLDRVCVHFSGALVTPLAASAHPLMTFAQETYSLDRYREIPFVLEKGRGSLKSLLPGLNNPAHAIAPEQKPLYHALCVMSGNFTTLLWEKAFATFARDLALPKEVLAPYLTQVAVNLLSAKQGQSVLTGPLARKDRSTISKNIAALANDPYAQVYQAFVDANDASFKPEPTPFPLGGL